MTTQSTPTPKTPDQLTNNALFSHFKALHAQVETTMNAAFHEGCSDSVGFMLATATSQLSDLKDRYEDLSQLDELMLTKEFRANYNCEDKGATS